METKISTKSNSTKEKKKIPFTILDDIRHLSIISPVTLREAIDYIPQPGEVCIDIYPRSGSNWMHNTVLNIFQKGQDFGDPQNYRKFCPLIDAVGLEGVRKMPKPGAYKTHLPFSNHRYTSEAKYIFMAREPKDCCVANYNFILSVEGLGLANMEFDDYFEHFMAGEVYCNDYCDHLLSWYPYRKKPNVFYTTYEYMKQNTEEVIRKLAAFLGKEYIEAIEQDNSTLKNILHNTSFEVMKKKLSPVFTFKNDDLSKMYPDDSSTGLIHIKQALVNQDSKKPKNSSEFFRKGIVGDWKNWFNPEQVERLDRKFRRKLEGTEILEWYS